MKRREPLQVGQIVRQAIEAAGVAANFDAQRVCYLWPEVVGQNINRLTTQRWVDHDVMHVTIASAPLKNELSFVADRIVDNLNRMAGKKLITRLIIH